MPSTSASARPFRDLILVLLPPATLLASPLLLWLARFGQNPAAHLPTEAVLILGALATGPLVTLLQGRTRRDTAVLALAAALVSILLALLLHLPPRYLLAPVTALLLAGTFRALRGPGPMLAAMTVYTSATVLANYTFDAFIPVGDLFLVNVGTFFFGITFTQRDRVHRYGRSRVYAMILFAAAANVAAALSLGTSLRYVAVGFLAIIVSESVDTEIYQRLLNRPWLVRVASSNAVSAPLDSAIFTLLAFFGEPFATPWWMARVILTDVIVKYASSLLAALPRLRPLPSSRAGRDPA